MASKSSKSKGIVSEILREYPAQKLRAIQKFARRKGIFLETEMEKMEEMERRKKQEMEAKLKQELLKYLESLFKKHVPPDVKFFVSDNDESPETERPEALSSPPGAENHGNPQN